MPEYGSTAAYNAGLGSSAGWAAAPSLGGVVSPGYPASSLLGTAAPALGSLGSPGSPTPGLADWIKDAVPGELGGLLSKVPWLSVLGGLGAGLLSGKGSGSSGTPFTPSAGLQPGALRQVGTVQQQASGPSLKPAQAYDNSGLARFGKPAAYAPFNTQIWGR